MHKQHPEEDLDHGKADQLQLPPVAYGSLFSDFLRAYYLAPDHPFKLRILGFIETLAKRKRIAVRSKHGFRIGVDRRDYIQKTVFHEREWEPEIANFLAQNLRKDDIFFDIGANVGYFTLLASVLGVAQIHSFEPNPELFELLIMNLRINDVDTKIATPHKLALSNISGSAMYQHGPIENSGTGKLLVNETAGAFNVAALTLDDFISKANTYPTVIKMDVEGHEFSVLEGGLDLFRHQPPRLIIFEADCDHTCSIMDANLLNKFEVYSYTITHLKRTVAETKENYVATLR